MKKVTSIPLKRLLFGFIAFVAIFSSEIALIVATSKFLSNSMIQYLPIVLLLVGVLSMFSFAFNLLISRKLSAAGSLTVTLILIFCLSLGCFIWQNNVFVFLFLSLLIARLSTVVFDTSVTNLASSYVNARQAKEFLPLIRGIMDVGVLCSSLFLFFVGSEYLINPMLVVAIGALVMIFSIQLVNQIFEPMVGENNDEAKVGLWQGLKQSIDYVKNKSKLFGLSSWFFICMGSIIVIFVYVYNQIFSDHLTGEALTRFIAQVSFWTVLGRSIFNFFLLKKAILKFGVVNLLMFYSWGMLIVSACLLFFSNNLYLAVVLYFFHVFSYYSYVTVTTQSMMGVVPKKLNQSIYFLIKGLIPAIFSLIASGLMILALHLFNNNALVPLVMLFVILSVMFLVVRRIKKEYQLTLIKCLYQEDIYLKASAVDLLGEKDQWERGEVDLRKMVVNRQESLEIRQKALTSLVEIGNSNSIRELLIILQSKDNLLMRYYVLQSINKIFSKLSRKHFRNMIVTNYIMLDTFNSIYEEDLPLELKLEVNKALKMFDFAVLMDFYKRHFENSSDIVKASIIESLATFNDRGLITLLEPLLTSDNLFLRNQSIVSLWKFEEMRDVLVENMKEIFARKDNQSRLISLKMISELRLKNMDDYVLDLVAYPDKEVSVMAVLTAISLGRTPAFKVLWKKLTMFAEKDDLKMVEFIFKKFPLLPELLKEQLVSELRFLNANVFNKFKQVYDQSDKLFDLRLVNLFTS